MLIRINIYIQYSSGKITVKQASSQESSAITQFWGLVIKNSKHSRNLELQK